MSDLEKIHASVVQSQTSIQNADRGRRRLIRGAVAVAPLILTLRSGALAAASCTGVKALNVEVNGTGVIQNPPAGIQAGDYCVIDPQTVSCPGQKISGGESGGVVVASAPDNKGKGEPTTQYQCSLVKGNQSNQTVAIVSSASASSLGFFVG